MKTKLSSYLSTVNVEPTLNVDESYQKFTPEITGVKNIRYLIFVF